MSVKGKEITRLANGLEWKPPNGLECKLPNRPTPQELLWRRISMVEMVESAVRELQEATALTHEGNVTVAGLGDDAIAGAKEA